MPLQVGQYVFSVAPPNSLPGTPVLGSPLAVSIKAGLADPTRSAVYVATPPSPTVGSAVTAQVLLADAYGNPITSPAAVQYNNSRLVVYGKHVLPAADE